MATILCVEFKQSNDKLNRWLMVYVVMYIFVCSNYVTTLQLQAFASLHVECVHGCVHACVHACVCMLCVCACVLACVCACVCMCVYTKKTARMISQ